MPAPVFRTLEGLKPYEETVTAMAAHAAAIRNGGAGEEVWLCLLYTSPSPRDTA